MITKWQIVKKALLFFVLTLLMFAFNNCGFFQQTKPTILDPNTNYSDIKWIPIDSVTSDISHIDTFDFGVQKVCGWNDGGYSTDGTYNYLCFNPDNMPNDSFTLQYCFHANNQFTKKTKEGVRA